MLSVNLILFIVLFVLAIVGLIIVVGFLSIAFKMLGDYGHYKRLRTM